MAEITTKDLVSKLDFIQNSVWGIEEMVIKNIGRIEKRQKDIEEIKSSLDLIIEKLKKLDNEIRALRNNNHA